MDRGREPQGHPRRSGDRARRPVARAPPGEPVTHPVSLSAPDLPTLLVEWLEELVYLAENDGFVPERIVQMDLSGSAVEAVVAGQRTTPQTLVKGVTYHRLEFEQDEEGAWHARVILDV